MFILRNKKDNHRLPEFRKVNLAQVICNSCGSDFLATLDEIYEDHGDDGRAGLLGYGVGQNSYNNQHQCPHCMSHNNMIVVTKPSNRSKLDTVCVWVCRDPGSADWYNVESSPVGVAGVDYILRESSDL